ncbi:4-(cytidine 5'-diphospho)-2-C-methyl-D-erythritol kinase [Hoeflea sp.]|uniref:4-(cytidine 5'-diphospho)-2-C-methyl-D-erythritol kinase n=1 Tax=Hoeflea sp. TaxID=1940281 RepID=UPI003B02E77B
MDETAETARAKINLALHVTGQRADGYHLIDSLVAFADLGDAMNFTLSDSDSLTIGGEFGSELDPGGDNLVARARDSLRQAADARGLAAPQTAIHLQKNLPVASGIGGGSADAAACLRGLMRLWRIPSDAVDLAAIAASLGADVPMCLVSRPLIARGIGENIEMLAELPPLPMVLVNPLQAVSTPETFGALANKNNKKLTLSNVPNNLDATVSALLSARNDLEEPARRIAPVIDEVRSAVAACHPLLVRMSGSGATVFGIFHDPVEARLAGDLLRDQNPQWWVRSTVTAGAPQEQETA